MNYSRIILFSALCLSLVGLWAYFNQKPAPCPLTFEQQKTLKAGPHEQDVFFQARDGQKLFYRFETHKNHDELVILLHGSSYHGAYLINLSEKLHPLYDVCIPDLRGHGKSAPPRGTCSYVGQLEDDLSDLITQLPKKYKKITLIGHSSGGGFAIRFASGKYKDIAQSLILLSPAIITAPTMNTSGARSWAHVDKITLAECLACNPFGITRFNTKTLITFNKPAKLCDGSETLTYDWNLAVSMHPRVPYKKDLARATPKAHIIVGENDEINNPYAFAKLFPKDRIAILKKVGHLDIVNSPDALKKIQQLLAEPTYA